ncbi:MAG: phosphate acyltransferase PlsX [Deltaproteobacteria bacterium]|nr:phosphate acyltransferase PlsX [Deltaproteobacteria bacterium]
MTVIALDGMGGDFSPRVPVEAALRAVSRPGLRVILVGDTPLLQEQLSRHGPLPEAVSIVHASQSVHMDESPAATLRGKENSSLRVAMELVAGGRAQAVVSAGHSGAMMVAAKHVLGSLPAIQRPAVATVLPLRRGGSLLLDCGANVDCKPAYLLEFARMGHVYAQTVMGLAQPRIALLNIGTEPGKGNRLTLQAADLLDSSGLRFVGSVEGRDLFRGKADVIVTDGFVGNLVLKTAESAANQVRALQREAASGLWGRLAYWMLKSPFKEVDRRTHYREVGGSHLLGLRGIAVVCHGASNSATLENAIVEAAKSVEFNLTEKLAQAFGADPANPGTKAGASGPQ